MSRRTKRTLSSLNAQHVAALARPRRGKIETIGTVAARVLERVLQQSVCDQLKALLPFGCFITAIPGGDRQQTRTPGYRSGSPDILVLARGIAIGIELKRADKAAQLSPKQSEVQIEWCMAGGHYALCRTPEEAVAVVSRFVPLRGRLT